MFVLVNRIPQVAEQRDLTNISEIYRETGVNRTTLSELFSIEVIEKANSIQHISKIAFYMGVQLSDLLVITLHLSKKQRNGITWFEAADHNFTYQIHKGEAWKLNKDREIEEKISFENIAEAVEWIEERSSYKLFEQDVSVLFADYEKIENNPPKFFI